MWAPPLYTNAGARTDTVTSDTKRRFSRGEGIAIKSIEDKKLKGKVKRSERITGRALEEAKKVYEWLKPCEQGLLEAEHAEKTWQFRQKDIVKVPAALTL
jgi:ribosomal protein L7/L12